MSDEKFFPVAKEAQDGEFEAGFLMRINVGDIKPAGQKTYEPEKMAAAAKQKLLEHISKRPTKGRRAWEDETLRLVDVSLYWAMMERLGFTSLPITSTEQGTFIGHPLCEIAAKEKEEVVDNASQPKL